MSKQTTRYWGIALFSIIYFFATLIVRKETGINGPSYAGILSLVIVWHALSGNLVAIEKTAVWALCLQLVGAILASILLGDNSIFIPTALMSVPWAVIFVWATSKVSDLQSSAVRQPPVTDYNSAFLKDALSKNIIEKQPSHAAAVEERKVNSKSQPSTNNAAQIILKYNDIARFCYEKLSGYPSEWQSNFLQRLVENPDVTPDKTLSLVLLDNLGRPDMSWSDEIWEALEKTRRTGMGALTEFINVFALLSPMMPPDAIATKVIELNRAEVVKQ